MSSEGGDQVKGKLASKSPPTQQQLTEDELQQLWNEEQQLDWDAVKEKEEEDFDAQHDFYAQLEAEEKEIEEGEYDEAQSLSILFGF